MSRTIQRVAHQLALPLEITDAIIDHVHDDIRALGNCSLVCSEWLTRSRYHIFSTVQLWPWRARQFFDLATSSMCTFVNQIGRIEVDDSRTARSTGKKENQDGDDGDEIMLFSEAMSQSHNPGFAGVRSLQIRNVDWTTLTSSERVSLRDCLTKFSLLNRLELCGVVFHDLREVTRIANTFPTLLHLTANITFMKYFEHTLASAMTTHLSNRLISLELATEEAIPVVLSSLANWDGPQSIRELKLQNIRRSDLQYIYRALGRVGKNLQHLSFGFQVDEFSGVSEDDLLCVLNFSSLSNIQTVRIKGVKLTKTSPIIEKSLPKVLESIESSFFEYLELQFQLEATEAIESVDLRPIERVILAHHFFGMKFTNIRVDIHPEVSLLEKEVQSWIHRGTNDLDTRGALKVFVIRMGTSDGIEMSRVPSSKSPRKIPF